MFMPWYTARAALDPAAAAGGDPNFASVVLLAINDNAADATTTFDDQSNSNHTMTANGSSQYETSQAPTGMTSSMDNTLANPSFLSAPASTDFTLTGDFTIEAYVWKAAFTANHALMGNGWDGFENQAYFNSSGAMNLYNGTNYALGATLGTSAWHHVAWVRSGTTVTGYIDGTAGTTPQTAAGTFFTSTDVPHFGYDGRASSGNWFSGYIASLRITKGVARYTADFTPPTLPLPTS